LTPSAPTIAKLERMSDGRPVRGSRAVARLHKVAARAVAITEAAGQPVENRCEQRLVSSDGLISGVVDLTVRSERLHAVIDYKTGAALDREGNLTERLVDQVALYCWL
jgi:ATP-dependent exoDNAse (exonuclease V) beta subunit